MRRQQFKMCERPRARAFDSVAHIHPVRTISDRVWVAVGVVIYGQLATHQFDIFFGEQFDAA